MSESPCKYIYLRHWITREGYPKDPPPRPVILECIPSRSGLSMAVYDRGERIFTINGCGFDRIGAALGEFLEACFQVELQSMGYHPARRAKYHPIFSEGVALEGAAGLESMREIAQAIGLKVHQSESKAGTLIIIEKGK